MRVRLEGEACISHMSLDSYSKRAYLSMSRVIRKLESRAIAV
jgi:hypothetical protein